MIQQIGLKRGSQASNKKTDYKTEKIEKKSHMEQTEGSIETVNESVGFVIVKKRLSQYLRKERFGQLYHLTEISRNYAYL